jgi:hypothetical protein
MVRKKRTRKSVAPQAVPTRQSFLGSVSIAVAMLCMMAMAVDAFLKASPGMSTLAEYAKDYLRPGEFIAAVAGFAIGIFSFGLSSKRQRNAVIGVVLNVLLMGGWFALRIYLR